MAIAARASQEFVKVKEIRDGIVVLKDGGLRAVLMASSINFALKSDDNQQAIISQFQNFLNSLDFSVQIVIESRRFDIRPYLAVLEEKLMKQKSELLKIQTREYIGFVKKFTDNTNIMNKSFFIVVPFSPAIVEVKSKQGLLSAFRLSKGAGHANTNESFEEHKSQLDQRVSVVEQGLVRTGVRVAQLGTEEIVELFYHLFNPGETEKALPTN
jgi:type IV secretory pathway VirB4 component